MLRALHLGNFKAFSATTRLPIRPITLIFGPNSAGKSSLIHGLVLGHEALKRDDLDISRTKLGGDSIDLGGFRQYVHRHALSQHVTWGVELEPSELFYWMQPSSISSNRLRIFVTYGLTLRADGRPTLGASPTLVSYQVEVGGEDFLRMRRRPDGRMEIVELTPALIRCARAHRAEEGGASPLVDDVLDEARLVAAISSALVDPIGLTPLKLVGEVDTAAREFLWSVLQGLKDALTNDLKRLTYLGPLRSYPPRHLAFTERDEANWKAGGGSAWDRMSKSRKLRDEVNIWLGSEKRMQTPYRLALQRFVAPETASSALGAALDAIFKKLSGELVDDDLDVPARVEAQDEIDEEQSPLERWDRDKFIKLLASKLTHDRRAEGGADLVLVDINRKTTVSHRDVGIGISQVLPVLVEAYGNKNRLVAIEQPEIHLHPRLQAEIADVFLQSALGGRGNTFLLETHSEHLILRVMRRIRETTKNKLPEGFPEVRPEHVAVLYVVPEGAGARIVEIPITDDGEFGAPWPGGFFPERMKELF